MRQEGKIAIAWLEEVIRMRHTVQELYCHQVKAQGMFFSVGSFIHRHCQCHTHTTIQLCAGPCTVHFVYNTTYIIHALSKSTIRNLL